MAPTTRLGVDPSRRTNYAESTGKSPTQQLLVDYKLNARVGSPHDNRRDCQAHGRAADKRTFYSQDCEGGPAGEDRVHDLQLGKGQAGLQPARWPRDLRPLHHHLQHLRCKDGQDKDCRPQAHGRPPRLPFSGLQS